MQLRSAVKKAARPITELLTNVVTRAVEPGLTALEARIEFVRRELLFELRYGARFRGIGATGAPTDGGSPPVGGPLEAKVLDEAKLRSFGDDIRLNLGAGHIPVDGYLNVDARQLPGIDIVADIRALPFGPGQVSTMFCAHLLEHFPVEEVRRSLLPYWHSILKPGGRLIVVVPDAEAMLDAYSQGQMSFSDLREVTFGAQEYDGDFHFNMYSKGSLAALLSEAGFSDVAITVSDRRNGLCREMQAEGRRAAEGLECG
jgi:SAM-dependent methyltransferase